MREEEERERERNKCKVKLIIIIIVLIRSTVCMASSICTQGGQTYPNK